MELRITHDIRWIVKPNQDVDSVSSAEEIINAYKETEPCISEPNCIYMPVVGKDRGVFDLCVDAGLPMTAMPTITAKDIQQPV